jgi:hypothetical protein
MDSLAILERGYLYPSPASIQGVKADCPYCAARLITDYRTGDLAIMMQTQHAGRLLKYSNSSEDGGVDSFEWLDEPGKTMRLMREHWLTLPTEAVTIPFWLPALDLRYCFIIDELATWFCNEGNAGERFHWDDNSIIEVIRTCWEKRIPICAVELSKVLLAHGLPEIYQKRVEELFEFGMTTLVASKGRKPLKKLRTATNAGQQLYDIWNNL